jgi:hypothetical protein
LTPTVRPEESIRGPPLLPGFIAASVWMRSRRGPLGPPIDLLRVETTPTVTVGPPKGPTGLPRVTTHWPTLKAPESPTSMGARSVASRRRRAMSRTGSPPSTFAILFWPSWRAISISFAPSTTWLLVRDAVLLEGDAGARSLDGDRV